MNSICIIGNLTADPQPSTDRDGNCCYFTVAVNRIGSDGADFFHVKAKGALADSLVKYKKKGDKVGVHGFMRMYRKDGEQFDRWMLGALGVEFCDRSSVGQQGQTEQPQANQGGQQGAAGGRRSRYGR